MGVISHNRNARVRANRKGVIFTLTCPNCERELEHLYSWQEIQALVQGRPLAGVSRNQSGGFTGNVPCQGALYSGASCYDRTGQRTVVHYSFGSKDFMPYWNDYVSSQKSQVQ